MIKLYWSPRSRSFSAIWLLEESGLPYERVLTDISTGAQKKPEYLAINPMGKVPGLKDGDAALGESAAICAYIADRYPETGAAVQIGATAAVIRRRYRPLRGAAGISACGEDRGGVKGPDTKSAKQPHAQ